MATTDAGTRAISAPVIEFDYPYGTWADGEGIPVYRDYFIEDLRTIKLGAWARRECNAAIIELVGQQGTTGAYVVEIGAGKTLPPFQMALDECIYVLEGRGLTTLKSDLGTKSFEWTKHGLFIIPGGHTYQLANMQGNQTARLLVMNYLPMAMTVLPEPELLLGQHGGVRRELEQFYSEARSQQSQANASTANYWIGNFFPDLRAWDRLDTMAFRGAGGRAVHMTFPGSPMSAHMSVFPSGTYKKGHRHGPGYFIVIPAGEGYSIMWPEGGEKVIVPWHEASCFVPPSRWFHQHFNVSEGFNRYLAIHPPAQFRFLGEKVFNLQADQIEYVNEEPWIRQKFEEELAKRGRKSMMEEGAYRDANHVWQVRT